MTPDEAMDRATVGGRRGSLEQAAQAPGPVDDDGTQYTVERILDHRVAKGRNAKRSFLVKWEGYPTSQATWEPERNVTEVSIDEYFERPLKKKVKPRHRASGGVADIDVSGPSGSADAGATGGTSDEAGRILLSMGRSAEALGGSPMAWAAHGEGSEVTGGVSGGGSDPGAFQPMDGPP